MMPVLILAIRRDYVLVLLLIAVFELFHSDRFYLPAATFFLFLIFFFIIYEFIFIISLHLFFPSLTLTRSIDDPLIKL